MSGSPDLAYRVGNLNEATAERVLQEVLDRLLNIGPALVVDNEDDARELVAALLTQYDDPTSPVVRAQEVLSPANPVDTYVPTVLQLLASDSQTAPLVEQSLDDLAAETQMIVDPVTAALILGAVVAFLQTKFNVQVERKDGKTDFSFSLSKQASSEKTVGAVLSTLRKAVLG